MKKIIDIDDVTLTKLKVISAFEDLSVKALMEKAVRYFVEQKEREKFNMLSDDEKEDLGLLLLMQNLDPSDTVPEEEIMKILKE
ncbi:MAG: hypothetical protein HWD84_04195 [Flavobacteriaceae bacterium]|jgi:hypothetical protein|nr:hypothetical protein [Flavobacteriaceae bacterium]NVJ73415.1 hypothetical protein [Flavobacteriaceae bacterium]